MHDSWHLCIGAKPCASVTHGCHSAWLNIWTFLQYTRPVYTTHTIKVFLSCLSGICPVCDFYLQFYVQRFANLSLLTLFKFLPRAFPIPWKNKGKIFRSIKKETVTQYHHPPSIYPSTPWNGRKIISRGNDKGGMWCRAVDLRDFSAGDLGKTFTTLLMSLTHYRAHSEGLMLPNDINNILISINNVTEEFKEKRKNHHRNELFTHSSQNRKCLSVWQRKFHTLTWQAVVRFNSCENTSSCKFFKFGWIV